MGVYNVGKVDTIIDGRDSFYGSRSSRWRRSSRLTPFPDEARRIAANIANAGKKPRAKHARGLPHEVDIRDRFRSDGVVGVRGEGHARLLVPPCRFSRFYTGKVKAQKHLGSEGNQHAANKSPGQLPPKKSHDRPRNPGPPWKHKR
jgi:hypothetical protein